VPNQTTNVILHKVWMVEGCERIFENIIDWRHIIDIAKKKLVRK
jgi:hypothetical protein